MRKKMGQDGLRRSEKRHLVVRKEERSREAEHQATASPDQLCEARKERFKALDHTMDRWQENTCANTDTKEGEC